MALRKAKGVIDKAKGVIDLTAEGISEADYLAAVRAIADEINDIRDAHRWCWVYVKFAAGLNPLITQGERHPAQNNAFKVRVNEPRPEDRMPREWFSDAGWEFYNRDQQDSERMAELRRTYGRILKIVKDEQITMEEAQGIFRRAKLPQYYPGGEQPAWKGYATIYTQSRLVSKDIAADQEKIGLAWKEFLAKTGLDDYGGYPSYKEDDPYQGIRIRVKDTDTEPLLGNPMWNYDPVTLPDGSRLRDIRAGHDDG